MGGVGVSALLLMADKVNLKKVSKITQSNVLVEQGQVRTSSVRKNDWKHQDRTGVFNLVQLREEERPWDISWFEERKKKTILKTGRKPEHQPLCCCSVGKARFML